MRVNSKHFMLTALMAALALSGCGDDGGSTPTPDAATPDAATPDAAAPDAAPAVLPGDWADEVSLTTLTDINADPDIVEVDLEAKVAQIELSPGVMTEMYTYNGVFPGPIIEVEKGQRLIVNFTNNLPEDTTIHFHGVELPATMDGSNIAQAAVAANGGTFKYEFDTLNAATHWYHPHIRTNEQVEKGLYGALVIRDPAEDTTLDLPEAEVTLLLDDILLATDGSIEPAFPTDPVANAAVMLNGREGNTFVVNGRKLPTIKALSGTPVRMRLINPANARFFRVSIPGHTLHRIGGDAGLIAAPVARQAVDLVQDPDDNSQMISNPDAELGVLLVPGERADVVFTPKGNAGDELFLEWHDIARGLHATADDGQGGVSFGDSDEDGKRASVQLVRFELLDGGDAQAAAYEPPATLRAVTAIDPNDAEADPLNVTFGHTPPDSDGNVTFFAKVVPGTGGVPFDQLTADDGLAAEVGKTYILEVVNLTGGDHPFHLHGFFFQHIETVFEDDDGTNQTVAAASVENKDSILIPARPGAFGTTRTRVRLAVTFDDTGREGQVAASGLTPQADSSGGWVLHCHILEHGDRGMMTFVSLTAP
ncbi:MAG: multicopper oxidase family protein [Haliangiales bacterium]